MVGYQTFWRYLNIPCNYYLGWYYIYHQTIQVPKMEGLIMNLIFGYFGGWGFPNNKPYPYSEHIGVSYLHFGYLICLVSSPGRFGIQFGYVSPFLRIRGFAITNWTNEGSHLVYSSD